MAETSDSELGLAEVIEFARESVEGEVDRVDYDVPEHATQSIVSNAVSIMEAESNFDAKEAAGVEFDEDARKDALEEQVVDLILSLGALDYEYDLRIADALERRKEFLEAFEQYGEQVKDAETEEAAIEAFDEHLAEHVDYGAEEAIGGGGVEPGDNVDDDDYESDPNRGIA